MHVGTGSSYEICIIAISSAVPEYSVPFRGIMITRLLAPTWSRINWHNTQTCEKHISMSIHRFSEIFACLLACVYPGMLQWWINWLWKEWPIPIWFYRITIGTDNWNTFKQIYLHKLAVFSTESLTIHGPSTIRTLRLHGLKSTWPRLCNAIPRTSWMDGPYS